VAWNNSKSNSTYAILPAALLWKYPNAKSNNIGGLMTLPTRSYLSPLSAKAKKKEMQKARAISWKNQLAATPICTWGKPEASLTVPSAAPVSLIPEI